MEEPVVVNKGYHEPLDLPPGFRFHPTDEEIITCYLLNKVFDNSFSAIAIGEADFNKSEPWDLPKKAKMGEKDWYFFYQRDRKYPTGMRTNRATESGYWKATGKDKEIYKGKTNQLIGMKKTLVFYKGRAPKGEKTNWVMHEFRLEGKSSTYNLPKPAKDEWVVSRVFHKNNEVKKTPISTLLRLNSIEDYLLDFSSIPPLMDPSYNGNNTIDNDIKNTNPSSSSSSAKSPSNGYYLPNLLINKNQQIPTNNFNNVSMGSRSTLFQPQTHQMQNPCSSFQQNMLSNYYIHQGNNNNNNRQNINDSGILDNNKQCKMEQFSSNNSMVSVSQNTCLTNDINTDTLSVVSKHEMEYRTRSLFEDFEDPTLTGPLSNFDCLWDDEY